ncbi:unnamed protein product [Prorocentrum cordatum]|uniref:Uncharacterized protein n=1 Tax=Prorocentrum cordatum TaxID=2364126 RepID=A0ABN9UJQ9_9DINO|nr:unnamed protein product [Polarella glacialis]
MRWPWSRPEPEAAPLAAQPAAAMPVAVVVPVPSAGPAAAPAGAPQGAGGAHVPPIPHSFAQQLQPMSEDELQQLVGADLLMDDLIFGMPEVQALQKRRREAHQELRDLAERVLRQEGEFKGALRACQEGADTAPGRRRGLAGSSRCTGSPRQEAPCLPPRDTSGAASAGMQ